MRHRRSIDLTVPTPDSMQIHDGKTLDTLWQWERIAAACGKCQAVTYLDKDTLMRKLGNIYLINLAPKLRCIKCGNRQGNAVFIGKAPRD